MAKFLGSGVYTGANEILNTHVLADEINVPCDIGNILILDITIDGNEDIAQPTGWDIVTSGTINGIGRHTFIKECTETNEQMPTIEVAGADTLSAIATVTELGAGATFEIGQLAINDGASANPVFDAITPQAHSIVYYLCGMDADTLLTVGGGKNVIEAADSGGNSSIMGYEYKPTAETTGQCIGTASADDGWQTVVIEIIDNASVPLVPTYYEKTAGSNLDATLWDNEVDFRDAIMANNQTLEGNTQLSYTFGSGDVDTGNDEIDIFVDDSAHRRVFRLTGTAPGGAVDGNYYYVEKLDATTIRLFSAGYNETFTEGNIDLTSTGGDCTLTECGIAYVEMGTDNEYDRFEAGFNAGDNYMGMASEYITPADFTNKVLGMGIQNETSNTRAVRFLAIDSSDSWKSWKIGKDLNYVTSPIQKLVDIEKNNTCTSAGTLDHTQIQYKAILYKPRTFSQRTKVVVYPYYELNNLITLGGDDIREVDTYTMFDTLNEVLQGTSNSSSFQFQFLHNIQFGNDLYPLKFKVDGVSLAFPPLADGINSFDAYLDKVGINHNLRDADTLTFTNSQIGSDLPWDFIVTKAQTLDYAGTIFKNATVTLVSGVTLSSASFGGGLGIFHNDATLQHCKFDTIGRAVGYLTLTETHNISNCSFQTTVPSHYAYEVAQAGDYTLIGDTFNGFNTDINVTATSGTVNITTDAVGTTYTSAGATVNIIEPSLSFDFTVKPSIAGYEWRIYEVDALGSLKGSAEVAGEETATEDNQSYVFSPTAGTPVCVQLLFDPATHDYEEVNEYYTLTDASQDVIINLDVDDNN